MNILDFNPNNRGDLPILDCMFSVTEELFFKYYKIYQPTVKDIRIPIDIDTYEGQLALKDYLENRVFEELMELRESIIEKHVEAHTHEEVADSLNFLINSYILYGWSAKDFSPIEKLWKEREIKERLSDNEIDIKILNTVYYIGLTCNKLKIRPWKKTQYLTDILIFEERFKKLFYVFMDLAFSLGLSDEDLWSVFSRKNQCNEFRIKTGY